MLAALLIFHVLLLRQFIEALIFRRFDLSGGPRKYYEFRLTGQPEETNLIGMFDSMKPEKCPSSGCVQGVEEGVKDSGYRLVDNDAFPETAGMTTGRCYSDPNKKLTDMSDLKKA
jgi:hypothetical protein